MVSRLIGSNTTRRERERERDIEKTTQKLIQLILLFVRQMLAALPDEPVDVDMLREHIELGRQFTQQAEERMRGNVNAVAAVVKSETEKLQQQMDSLAKMCVPDLPKHWDQIKSGMDATRRLEKEALPGLDRIETENKEVKREFKSLRDTIETLQVSLNRAIITSYPL